MTFPHLTVAGFGTFVSILTGLQLWFVATPYSSPDVTSIKCLESLPSDGVGKGTRWEVFALHKGDLLSVPFVVMSRVKRTR